VIRSFPTFFSPSWPSTGRLAFQVIFCCLIQIRYFSPYPAIRPLRIRVFLIFSVKKPQAAPSDAPATRD